MSSVLDSLGIRPLPELEASISAGQQHRSHDDILHSINLRDLGEVTPIVHHGLIFRSSQVVSPSHLRQLGIRSVMDLRQAGVGCRASPHNFRQALGRAISSLASWFWHAVLRRPRRIGSRVGLLYSEKSLEEAPPCWKCSSACQSRYGVPAQLFHVDLLPWSVSITIFASLPHWLQAKVAVLKLRGKFPEPLVAAAIADPKGVMGYHSLYKILLTRSRPHLISALRLLRDSHFPILIHCQHGKDRTGLVVMLIYLLCGVPRDVIVSDYALSESLLREGRENRQLLGMEEAFTTDEIIASSAEVMEQTLDFIDHKYGGVEEYLRGGGMRDDEFEQIRSVLC